MTTQEILVNLGYKPVRSGREFRCSPIYRESTNNTALRVFEDGRWTDFGTGKCGNLAELVKITLNLADIDKAKEYLGSRQYVAEVVEEVLLETPQTFEVTLLDVLEPKHAYWVNRGVSEAILKEFKGGVCNDGIMRNRYVFPVFNSRKELVGLDGRDISGKSPIKWKKKGSKSQWVYPFINNRKDIERANSVILVESIGDLLSLFECGVRNVLVTFGIKVAPSIISVLTALNIGKITVALNNDAHLVGNNAAKDMRRDLKKHFDNVEIKLPTLKDFNEMLMDNPQSIKEWNG